MWNRVTKYSKSLSVWFKGDQPHVGLLEMQDSWMVYYMFRQLDGTTFFFPHLPLKYCTVMSSGDGHFCTTPILSC